MSHNAAIDHGLIQQELAYSIGLQAYIFSLPLALFERERRARAQPAKGLATINRFVHSSSPASSGDKLVCPLNSETICSTALLELAEQPIVLSAPDILSRYWCLEVADAYGEAQLNIGSRASDGLGGRHVFVGPDFTGELPADLVVHRMPCNSIMFTLRIGVDKNELDRSCKLVRIIQSRFNLTSLNRWSKGELGADVPSSLKLQAQYQAPLGFFELVAKLMQDNPPPLAHQKYAGAFKHIGLVPGQDFELERLAPEVRQGLVEAISKAEQLIPQMVKHRDRLASNHWVARQPSDFVHDYLNRAAKATEGLFAHSSEEVSFYSSYQAYVSPMFDGKARTGEFLNSSHQYVLHFEPDEIPRTQENGFWSISLCTPERQLIENELNLYSINDTTEGVVTNEDGSIDFYIQSERPVSDKCARNWLPCPKTAGQQFCLNYCVCLPNNHQQDSEQDLPSIPPIMKRNAANSFTMNC